MATICAAHSSLVKEAHDLVGAMVGLGSMVGSGGCVGDFDDTGLIVLGAFVGVTGLRVGGIAKRLLDAGPALGRLVGPAVGVLVVGFSVGEIAKGLLDGAALGRLVGPAVGVPAVGVSVGVRVVGCLVAGTTGDPFRVAEDVPCHRARLLLSATKAWNSLYERWSCLVHQAPL